MEVFSVYLIGLSIALYILRNLIKDVWFFPLVFILLTIAGIIIYPWKNEINIWDIFTAVGGGSTLALAFLALVGYLDYIRQNDKIDIYLRYRYGKKEKEYEDIPTELKVLRKNCTRAEIQGLIRLLSAGKTFTMESIFNKKDILDKVDKIQTGREKEIFLDVKKEEIAQFIELPNYEEILTKCKIVLEKKEKPIIFTKKTQEQIDNIEKILESIKKSNL